MAGPIPGSCEDEEVESLAGFSRRGFLPTDDAWFQAKLEVQMNTFERRQIAREQMIDAVIAKAAINKSRRARKEVTRKLSKDLAAARSAAVPRETISYSSH